MVYSLHGGVKNPLMSLIKERLALLNSTADFQCLDIAYVA